jgi:ferrous iron transport protein B
MSVGNESSSVTRRDFRVALLGNPNTGKSTLFSSLTGTHQRIGNYPGVTVEKKVGWWKQEQFAFELIDLPGTYSLAPRSPDEMVTVDILLGQQPLEPRPELLICIVDASNLNRNLFLVSQAMELGIPIVVALNMTDVAMQKGLIVDSTKLEEQLGCPVVPIQAHKRVGLDVLKRRLIEQALALHGSSKSLSTTRYESPMPVPFRQEAEQLVSWLKQQNLTYPLAWVGRLLLDTSGYMTSPLANAGVNEGQLQERLEQARKRLATAGFAIPAVEPIHRYQWCEKVLDGVIQREVRTGKRLSDRIDAVLTHRVWGSLIFVAIMFLMFQSIFAWSGILSEGIESGISFLQELVGNSIQGEMLRSLATDGILGGVGGVLVFIPQIMILFLFIALLEDCGYMARAAYLMDRLMSRVGLSGKSFIPLLSSFACAIPGIMAARVIENRRDRLATILIAPLMSCSARLPVYILMTEAFVPDMHWLGGWVGLRGLTMLVMYLVGGVAAVPVAWLLKKTLLRGETPPFLLELPSYKIPSLKLVILRMLQQGWAFVSRAGTLILAVTVIIWALGYFPRNPDTISQIRSKYALSLAEDSSLDEDQKKIVQVQMENEISGALLRESYLGQAGRAIEPLVKPLGWDWRIGSAVIASFPAREVVIGTLGVIYNLGNETDEENASLRERLQAATWDDEPQRKVFNLPVALSIMVFFALCSQCVSTLAVMWRETNSWKWPVFAFTYMTALAYVGALVTYQLFHALGI